MQIPQSMQAECPECGEETQHRTLKGRMKGKKRLEMVLKCGQCGKVRDEVLELIGKTPVRMIISRGQESEKTSVEFPADWVLSVGDEFMHEDENLQVTGIESGGKRVKSAPVGEIKTLWTMNFDQAKVKVAINRHGRTKSVELYVDPDEEFEIGSEITIDGVPVTIHSIKLQEKRIRRGTANAREIVRVYCTDSRPSRPRYRKR